MLLGNEAGAVPQLIGNRGGQDAMQQPLDGGLRFDDLAFEDRDLGQVQLAFDQGCKVAQDGFVSRRQSAGLGVDCT